jgi:hypothetical protein
VNDQSAKRGQPQSGLRLRSESACLPHAEAETWQGGPCRLKRGKSYLVSLGAVPSR